MKSSTVLALFLATLSNATAQQIKCSDVGELFSGICTNLGEQAKPILTQVGTCASKCTDEACKKDCVVKAFQPKLDLKEIKLIQDCLEKGKADHSQAVKCTGTDEKIVEKAYECVKGCGTSETCRFGCGTKIYEARMNQPEKNPATSSSESKSESSTSNSKPTSVKPSESASESSSGSKPASKPSAPASNSKSGSNSESKTSNSLVSAAPSLLLVSALGYLTLNH